MPRLTMTETDDYPRFASRGRGYVYVFPCRDADELKLGFSREPLERLHTLHRRYFEFFDLDRGLLVETDRVADARKLERLCITTFASARSTAPLAIRDAAGGHTEWFRGIADDVGGLLRRVCEEEGLVLHDPLSAWLRAQFEEFGDAIHDWSACMLAQIEYEHFNPSASESSSSVARVLRDVLDACLTVGGKQIEKRIPNKVLEWYHMPSFSCRF